MEDLSSEDTMPIRYLTVEQHRKVLENLVRLARNVGGTRSHADGWEYTSLMVCFLLHNMASAESLLRLSRGFGEEWFPSTVGYAVARTMFEIDVNAHYISQEPRGRALQYIHYGRVLAKKRKDTIARLRKSTKPDWSEAMTLAWQHEWAHREEDIEKKFDEVRCAYKKASRGVKPPVYFADFRNWSGISISEMARQVDHEEAYQVFYAELSSFSHADIHLADRFLKAPADGASWSQRAVEFDVGNVYRYAAIFLTCFLNHFGLRFGVWTEEEVAHCWEVEGD